MKLQIHKPNRAQGSVILICLCIAAVLGILLASYLVYTQVQNTSVSRSQNWNGAMVLTEAGVEEALAHLNRKAPYFNNTDGLTTLESNGWDYQGWGIYKAPRRYLGNNLVNPTNNTTGLDYYDVSIDVNGGAPIIYSTGFVYMASIYSSAPQTMFAAAGVGGTGTNRTYYSSRRLTVKTKVDGIFTGAMAAINQIDFKGQNVSADSFDSSTPTYSTNWNGYYGYYPAGITSKTKDGGDVVTDGDVLNTLNVGNANIKGKVNTGPNGTLAIGPNGSVGSKSWVEGGTTGVESGWSKNDMNVVFPDVVLPGSANSWSAPSTTKYTAPDGVKYDYRLGDGDYKLSSISGMIYVDGNARIYLTSSSSFTQNGGDVLVLATNTSGNVSLKMYVAGSVDISGNGVVNNTGNAENFALLGLSTSTSIRIHGNGSLTGVIYAPQADLELGGGGNDNQDLIGASVSKTVKMNGKFNFHYDESLANKNFNRGFIPTDWKEK